MSGRIFQRVHKSIKRLSVSFAACFQLQSLEAKVAAFNEVRVQHDHYRIKVDDLKVKVRVNEMLLRYLCG